MAIIVIVEFHSSSSSSSSSSSYNSGNSSSYSVASNVVSITSSGMVMDHRITAVDLVIVIIIVTWPL